MEAKKTPSLYQKRDGKWYCNALGKATVPAAEFLAELDYVVAESSRNPFLHGMDLLEKRVSATSRDVRLRLHHRGAWEPPTTSP